ncbi:MAG: ATP-binding protein [Cyclobacteriaceae bacterium]|nr:ATP-binding protein [Cyclobacteriaceae bacterium]
MADITHETLLQNLPVSIVVTDNTNTIVYVNEYFKVQFEPHSPGENIADLIPDFPDDYLVEFMRDENRINGFYSTKIIAGNKDSAPFDIALKKFTETQEQFIAMVITPLKEADAIKEEYKNFVNIVSHDLKAPIRSVNMLSDIILDDYGDKVDEEGKEMFALIKVSLGKLNEMIDGLLQLSRVVNRPERFTAINTYELLNEITRELATGSDIKINYGVDIPPINGAFSKIKKLFLALVQNAYLHNDKDNKIVSITFKKEGDQVHFSVSDNGPGIPLQHHERVFEVFQKLVARDDSPFTGVGLSLAKKIVEVHGGKIWIETNEAPGTTVSFSLNNKL